MKHIYSEWALKYLEKGYKTIPDKYASKMPAVSKWTSVEVTEAQVLEWINSLKESNIAILTGKVSGVIALDLDCVNPEIVNIIEPLLPPSPVERRGSKGWVRFFQYTGEQSYCMRHDGEVVLEILSDLKKCTIAPSKHPSGMDYKWLDKGLLDVDINELPKLPPFLISHIESKLRLEKPESTITKGKILNGRNDLLSSECGKLIHDMVPLDLAIQRLIELDEEMNETPLFSDESEYYHTERFTNALQFYSNHLSTVNGRRFKKNETYEIPITASAISSIDVEDLRGKLEHQQENLESSRSIESSNLVGDSLQLPVPKGILKEMSDTINTNSYIKQPAFALSASLVFLATLTGRKMIFRNSAPNLYILNVANSGSGKNVSQELLKDFCIEVGAEDLLGGGDYVSDASLTDSLPMNPVRLDIIDEASTLLKTASFGGAEYNKKIAEILCQLYTSSNNMYLGRSVAEGRKGQVSRPNVNLYCSTTPAGITESVTPKSIDKGLLGRFLVFIGKEGQSSTALSEFPKLLPETVLKLKFLAGFQPPQSDSVIGGMSQEVYKVNSTEQADIALNRAFKEFDNKRLSEKQNSSLLPVIARLYQQMIKIALIHAVSRTNCDMPVVEVEDVTFSYELILYYLETMRKFIDDNIVRNPREREIKSILKIIQAYGLISEEDLFDELIHIEPKKWQAILKDLVQFNKIEMVLNNSKAFYKLKETK